MSAKSILTGCAISVGALVVFFGGCAVLFGTNYNQILKEGSGEAEISDTSWVPTGFQPFNNDVAIKWSESGTFSCDFGQSCVQMEAVSKGGCDSLYVELAKLDSSGNNVGFTNETTSGLDAGQKAILKFEMFGDYSSVKVSKVSCY